MPVLPEEWGATYFSRVVGEQQILLFILFWFSIVIAAVFAAKQRRQSLQALCLQALPFAAVGYLFVATFTHRWPAIHARYMFSSLPYFSAGLGIASLRTIGPMATMGYSAALLATVISIWVSIG
jgi:hypothetical protein